MTDRGTTIRQLTSAMAKGDARAIECFYRDFFEMMYLEARRASRRDEQFCLDIVQDAVLKIIRAVTPMETEPQLVRWIRRVVRNAAYDKLRAEIRRKRREADSASQSPADTQSPGQEELEAQISWLAMELKTMDAGETRLLCARYQWGWTLQRIGQELGLSAGAVDGRLRRLVARLSRRYRESCNEE